MGIVEDRKKKFELMNPGSKTISSTLIRVRRGKNEKIYNLLTGEYLDGEFKGYDRLEAGRVVLLGVDDDNIYKILAYPTGELFRFEHDIFIIEDYIEELGIDIIGEEHKNREIVKVHFLDIPGNEKIGYIDIKKGSIDINIEKINGKKKVIKIEYVGDKNVKIDELYVDSGGIYKGVKIFGKITLRKIVNMKGLGWDE